MRNSVGLFGFVAVLALLVTGCERSARTPTELAHPSQQRWESTTPPFDRSRVSPEALRVPESQVDHSDPALASLVTNGSFENNGGEGSNVFAGWRVWEQEYSYGSWFVQTGSTSPVSRFEVPPPTHGFFAAMSDQTFEGSHILYQDVAIPTAGAELRFDLFIGNRNLAFHTPPTLDYGAYPNQQFRMDIMDPAAPIDDVGAGVLRMVYRTEEGDDPVTGYRTITASLDAFAGQTVRLRFAAVQNQWFLQVGIDHVRVISREAPPGCQPVDLAILAQNREITGIIDLRLPTVSVAVLGLPDLGTPDPPALRSELFRIGEAWETATPASSAEITDVNGDGRPDLLLGFQTERLVEEGNLSEATEEIMLWGRHPRTGARYCGTAAVSVITEDPPVRPGRVLGRVVDAWTSRPIEGAIVDFGQGIAVSTDDFGYFSVELPPGIYQITISAEGYVTEHRPDVVVEAGREVFLFVPLTPRLQEGAFQIVLSWDPYRDLDAHLTGPTPGADRFHVFWGSPGDLNSAPYAALIHDDRTGFEKEPIVITRLFSGTYRYSVHDFTAQFDKDGRGLAASRARVEVFRDEALLAEFFVPNREGTLWTVFEIDGATGEITPINRMSFTPPPASLPARQLNRTDAEIIGAAAARAKP